jgi:CelD/BcsL family acetyltransferase involved in cellulose biosynthesis
VLIGGGPAPVERNGAQIDHASRREQAAAACDLARCVTPPTLSTDVQPLTAPAFSAMEAAWRELELRCEPAHYSLTHEWLTAWTAVYAPAALLLVRIADGERLRGAGLLEQLPGGRWRFAGGAVTPHRHLLCAPEDEAAVWTAWGGWLAENRSRWSLLEGDGVPAQAGSVPGATLEPVPEYAVPLPGAFEDYLAARSPGTRRGLRQKLNRLPRFEAAVAELPREQHAPALERFVALHRARASEKGERHPYVDARLSRLLLGLRPEGRVELRLFELTARGRPIGISVRLDYGQTAYFYNAGFDPGFGYVSPGIVLELESIRDAIERGLTGFDLGPGEYRYKLDLGGQRRDGHRLVASSPSLRGSALAGAYRVRRALRRRSA